VQTDLSNPIIPALIFVLTLSVVAWILFPITQFFPRQEPLSRILADAIPLLLGVGGFWSILSLMMESPWFSLFVPYRRWRWRSGAFVALQILLLSTIGIGQWLTSPSGQVPKAEVMVIIVTEFTVLVSFVITVLTLWWIMPLRTEASTSRGASEFEHADVRLGTRFRFAALPVFLSLITLGLAAGVVVSAGIRTRFQRNTIEWQVDLRGLERLLTSDDEIVRKRVWLRLLDVARNTPDVVGQDAAIRDMIARHARQELRTQPLGAGVYALKWWASSESESAVDIVSLLDEDSEAGEVV